MAANTIAVIGGFGQAGKAIVRHLVKYTDAQIRICDRRADNESAFFWIWNMMSAHWTGSGG